MPSEPEPPGGRRPPAEFDVAALRAHAHTHVPVGPRPALEPPPPPAEPRTWAGRLRGTPARTAAAALTGAAVGALWLGLGGFRADPGPAGAALGPAADWSAVVRDLDRGRARAFSAADAAALRRVYAPGSAALATDEGRLAALRARGLRGEGLAVEVVSVRLREANSGRVDLAVVDRLDGYTLTDRRGRVRASMPGRGEAGWHVRLVPSASGGWRIDSIAPA